MKESRIIFSFGILCFILSGFVVHKNSGSVVLLHIFAENGAGTISSIQIGLLFVFSYLADEVKARWTIDIEMLKIYSVGRSAF